MKKIYLFLATAALFAACASDDLSVQEQPQVQAEEGVVGFDVYMQKATTRRGEPGTLTTTGLKTGAFADDGFGVFGYYTDNNDYEQRSTPNFFYNQQVKWVSDAWIYEPVKYWPNEYGGNAKSDDADKVTYFAYAPWVPVVASSGKISGADADKSLEQWGIVGMTKNTTQGDPMVKYIASFNSNKSVDLCWGVADNNDGVWPTVQNEATMNIANGTPWLNVLRPANVGQKVKFTFKHATAQMRININAIVDEVRPGVSPKDLHKKTRIWVREVKFKGFALKGTLNLNNDDNTNKPYWLDYNGQNELVAEDVTVFDGRKDGKEGVNGAIATNEKVLGLNPALVQDGYYSVADPTTTKVYDKDIDLVVAGVNPDPDTYTDATKFHRPGVTTANVNLFAQDESNQNGTTSGSIFHVIPVDENFEIEIVYDVETVSENLAQNLSDGQTKGSSIENRIRKTITFGDDNSRLLPGHSYELNLHLGMNSVEFDAAVTDWIEEATQDVDLPLNTPMIAAGNIDAKVTLPYVQPANKYTFAIYGLNGGESVTRAWTDPTTQLTGWDAATTTNAWTNGYDLITLTTKANPLTTDRTQKATWTGNQSTISTVITFTQQAHPLFMKITAVDAGAKTITLTRYDDANQTTSDDWTVNTGWFCNNTGAAISSVTTENYIKVWRNGVELDNSELSTSETAGKKFKFSDAGTVSTATITLLDTPQKGDVYMVTLKTGTAPAETVSFKVP